MLATARRPPSAVPGGGGTRASLAPTARSRAPLIRRQRAASSGDAAATAANANADDVRARLRSLIARLSARADAPDDPALRAELVSLLPQLRAANPTPAPAVSPKIDGVWVLVATVPKAAAREQRRSPLQAAFALLYDFFYQRIPIIAGSAVGKKGAAGAISGASGSGSPSKGPPSSSSPAVRARGNFQTFDVPNGIVRNRAVFEAFGLRGEVNVDGTARVLSDERLEATFTTAGLRLGERLSVPFPIGAFRPTGWVDTLYLDDDVRVSTGDKGSVFVARRARGGGGGSQG